MADINESLPIKTIIAGDVAVKLVDSTNPAQQLKVNADGSVDVAVPGSVEVTATALDIRPLHSEIDSIKSVLQVGAAVVSDTNPVPVRLTRDNIGDEINNFSFAPIANATPLNHDYQVSSGKTLLLNQILASASGRAKIELQIETGPGTGIFATNLVLFNSVSAPNMEAKLANPISVASGVKVRLVKTNRENQTQDIYTTISGQEV